MQTTDINDIVYGEVGRRMLAHAEAFQNGRLLDHDGSVIEIRSQPEEVAPVMPLAPASGGIVITVEAMAREVYRRGFREYHFIHGALLQRRDLQFDETDFDRFLFVFDAEERRMLIRRWCALAPLGTHNETFFHDIAALIEAEHLAKGAANPKRFEPDTLTRNEATIARLTGLRRNPAH